MDVLQIIFLVVAIGISIVRYIIKAFNETASTATAPPVSPKEIKMEKRAPRQRPSPSPTSVRKTSVLETEEEGMSITPSLQPTKTLATPPVTNEHAPDGNTVFTRLKDKNEAKKAFLYAEIFNRKYS